MSTQSDLRQSLVQRAQELFALCDYTGKGYAFKEEIGALANELPLSPEQLEDVFDALDVDGDGQLTLQEFTDGFGMFLGIDSHPRNFMNDAHAEEEEEDEDEVLEELLDHLGARNLFTDEDFVREMWHRVRKDDDVMRSNFENFISKMAVDLKQSVAEKDTLESTLKSREQENESRVQSLYEEMEEQLQNEKEEAMAREQRKEQQLRDELETELQEKDSHLQELLEKHAEMQRQLEELNSGEVETKHENLKLQKDRDVLESRLADSEKMLEDMKNHMSLLRKKSLEEKRKRAQAALKVSENIALERENMVLELQTLKEINKQLLDEKDELVQTAAQLIPVHKSVERKQKSPKFEKLDKITEETTEKVIPDFSRPESRNSPALLDRKLTEEHPLTSHNKDKTDDSDSGSRLAVGHEEDDQILDIRNNLNFPSKKIRNGPVQNYNACETQMNTFGETFRKSERKSRKKKSVDEVAAPSRVFKVVFVGDSGVGKTSILQRFCTEDFKPSFNATVGVDFQVKTISVDGERIAVQLWDTAGQERFRSMTQQYFRKSDGIIVVYDVTVETSFRNVRNWMHSIEEGAQDTSVVLLIGNKIDLCESEDDRVVKSKDGERMADEYGTLFYETSAKTGSSIEESIHGLASILKTKEDEAMEQVLKLQEEINERRKKKCC